MRESHASGTVVVYASATRERLSGWQQVVERLPVYFLAHWEHDFVASAHILA